MRFVLNAKDNEIAGGSDEKINIYINVCVCVMHTENLT